ncbi:hypothetical protein [Deinococcus hohokamensis]|uniref:Uncharacterized protein n=1 Tax=Deinococcus hohokamensis TaxID=309883 RepID=A0ABV9I720_9DEIO
MTALDDTLQPLRTALSWFAETGWGRRKGYSTQTSLWAHFRAQGLWHLVPLCAVGSWEDLPGVHPYVLCLRIDLRFPVSGWPVVMVDAQRQCTTLASRPAHLALALLNHHLYIDGQAVWEEAQELWRDLHCRVGGDADILEGIEKRLQVGEQVLFTRSEVDERAEQAFRRLPQDSSENAVTEGSLLDLSSPWSGAVNSRVLDAFTSMDIDTGGTGDWPIPVLSRGMELLKAPAPYDISNEFPPLHVTVVGSAWYYLFASLRSNLLTQPSFVVPEGYGKLIEHGAEQALSGIEYFELAAHESSVQHDQITAFHHLISAAFWALEQTLTELPEAHQMAIAVARLHEHADAVEALEHWERD